MRGYGLRSVGGSLSLQLIGVAMRITVFVLLVVLCQLAGCGESDTWWDYGEGKVNLKGVRSLQTHMTMTLKSSKGLPDFVERGIPDGLVFESWEDEELIQYTMQKLRKENNASPLELELAANQVRVLLGLAKLAPNAPIGQIAKRRPDWKCTIADGPINEATIQSMAKAVEFIGAEVEMVSWEATIMVDDLSVKLPGFDKSGIPFTGAESCVKLARRWLDEAQKVERLAG